MFLPGPGWCLTVLFRLGILRGAMILKGSLKVPAPVPERSATAPKITAGSIDVYLSRVLPVIAKEIPARSRLRPDEETGIKQRTEDEKHLPLSAEFGSGLLCVDVQHHVDGVIRIRLPDFILNGLEKRFPVFHRKIQDHIQVDGLFLQVRIKTMDLHHPFV